MKAMIVDRKTDEIRLTNEATGEVFVIKIDHTTCDAYPSDLLAGYHEMPAEQDILEVIPSKPKRTSSNDDFQQLSQSHSESVELNAKALYNYQSQQIDRQRECQSAVRVDEFLRRDTDDK
jgi:hypothetical protein